MHTKMKRIGHLFEKVVSMDNLRLAHINARKGKGWYKEVIEINKDPDKYLKIIQEQLINKTYKTSEYEVFIKKDGTKEREIFKLPYFPDRICQWAIIQVIEPYLINHMTIDTYSAIPKRGIHFGFKRIQHDIQTDVKGCQYCLKLDVRKYYPSIDHDILKEKYARLFKDKDLLWVIYEIIDSTDGKIGVPIGNYLSQYSGNFYFSSFDHWLKECKHVKHYHRYMDDLVIFGETKEELHLLLEEIKIYLNDVLNLKLKDNYQIFPTYVRGVDFLGYRFFMNYVLLRKSTCKQMKRKLIKIQKKVSAGNMINYSEWCCINSYEGWLMHCDSYRLKRKYIRPLLTSAELYYQVNIKRKAVN